MSLLKRFADSRPTHRRHRKYFQVDLDDEMGFFSHPTSAHFLSAPHNPARKLSSASARPRDDVDEFLSSDLELSFASTVSLNSPSHLDYEPMDISPVPFCKVVTRPKNDNMVSKSSMRPRAFTSAAIRGFGNDVSNGVSAPANSLMPQSKPDTIQTKRIQRSALPSEWLAFSRPQEDRLDENDMPTATVSPPSHFGPFHAFDTISDFNVSLCVSLIRPGTPWTSILRLLWPRSSPARRSPKPMLQKPQILGLYSTIPCLPGSLTNCCPIHYPRSVALCLRTPFMWLMIRFYLHLVSSSSHPLRSGNSKGYQAAHY